MQKAIIFLDTETTSIEDPGLIQLSFIKRCPNEVSITFNHYFKTDKKISLEAMSVCHITPKILEEQWLELNDAQKEIIETMLQNSYIVAHNAKFDKRVLDLNGIKTEDHQWIDTYPIAYELYPEASQHKLQYLRYYLWLEFKEEINPHDSMSDVIVLEAVFQDMKDKIESQPSIDGAHDSESIMKELKEITDRGIILRTFTFGKYAGRKVSDIAREDRGYLNWLYESEMKKWESERNTTLYNTLQHYLK